MPIIICTLTYSFTVCFYMILTLQGSDHVCDTPRPSYSPASRNTHFPFGCIVHSRFSGYLYQSVLQPQKSTRLFDSLQLCNDILLAMQAPRRSFLNPTINIPNVTRTRTERQYYNNHNEFNLK